MTHSTPGLGFAPVNSLSHLIFPAHVLLVPTVAKGDAKRGEAFWCVTL